MPCGVSFIPLLTGPLLWGIGVEFDVLLGFSAGEDSGVTTGLAGGGSFSAAGVIPKGDRKSRKGPAQTSIDYSAACPE